IASARAHLLARAAKISDPTWRERFLTAGPPNARAPPPSGPGGGGGPGWDQGAGGARLPLLLPPWGPRRPGPARATPATAAGAPGAARAVGDPRVEGARRTIGRARRPRAVRRCGREWYVDASESGALM